MQITVCLPEAWGGGTIYMRDLQLCSSVLSASDWACHIRIALSFALCTLVYYIIVHKCTRNVLLYSTSGSMYGDSSLGTTLCKDPLRLKHGHLVLCSVGETRLHLDMTNHVTNAGTLRCQFSWVSPTSDMCCKRERQPKQRRPDGMCRGCLQCARACVCVRACSYREKLQCR